MQQPTRLISTPFAQEGEKTEIQNVTGEFDNSATYRLGFPPLTMQSIRLGGKPPKGTDFNGILFDITENISFLCKGGRYQYNAGLSTLIGGYPEGSNLLLDDNVTEVVSTVAGNQNNPNTDMTGWILKPNRTTAVNVADASGETQQQVNYNGGSKWHSRAGGYLKNERVILANGDIVKSTIDGNVNDPNSDMTGWRFDDDTVESIADMLAIENPKDGMRVFVKSYHPATNLALAKPFKGGSEFVFNISKSSLNDGITVFNGWERIYSNLSVDDAGAKGDGVTDDTTTVNNLVMYLYKNGGGVVNFPESPTKYKLNGTVYVVSNVIFNVNGQILSGSNSVPMFKTANIVGDQFFPITIFDPLTVVRAAQIVNAKIQDTLLAFDFISFTLSCSVKNIEFENCRQGFKLEQCFYSRWENLQATPTGGSIDIPFYHLVLAANAMIFDRVSATTPWGWLIEGGNTALLFNACTFEGGERGFKFKNDNLGITFQGCYFEAVTGTLFDFSESGNCLLKFFGNYINGVDIIFQDGGSGTLFGEWGASNAIVNIGGTLGTGFTFRGLMNVSGAKNYIDFRNERNFDGVSLGKPSNWNVGKATNLTEHSRWVADGIADVRANAEVHQGIIPVKYSGDFGAPYPGFIHYCTKSAIPTGVNVSFTIDTQLTYQDASLFVKILLKFQRVDGIYQRYDIWGDVYGSRVVTYGGIDPDYVASGAIVVTASNNAGKLRLTLSNVQNPNGDLTVTGTVRAVS